MNERLPATTRRTAPWHFFYFGGPTFRQAVLNFGTSANRIVPLAVSTPRTTAAALVLGFALALCAPRIAIWFCIPTARANEPER
jgi:hypothetical protein